MQGKWSRLVSLILCLTVLLTPLPTGAEYMMPEDAIIIAEDEAAEQTQPGQEALPAEPGEIFTDTAQEQLTPPAAEDAAGEGDGAADSAATPQPGGEANEELVDDTDMPADIPSSADDASIPVAEPEPLPGNDGVAEEFARRWTDVLDVASQDDEYHKALLLYDSLIYNYTPGSASNALEALTQRSADAAGYALSYELLLNAVGIECVTVFEDEYAWNLARLDGAWTHIDVYADDISGHYGYHFGLTDAVMVREHHWEGFPASTDTQQNYFVREQNYAAFTGNEDLIALLSVAIGVQADTISLYSAGDMLDVAQVIGELYPDVDGSMSSSGPYITIHFNWAKARATAAPSPAPAFEERNETQRPDETEHPIISMDAYQGMQYGTEQAGASQGDTADGDAVSEEPIPDESGDIVANDPIAGDADDAVVDEPAADETVEEPSEASVDQDINQLEVTQLSEVANVEPSSIVPASSELSIGVNESRSIADWSLLPEGAHGEVSYVSESANIATVNNAGIVTGKKAGTTKLRISLKDDPDINCLVNVTVRKAPTSISISGERTVLGVGETMQASYKLSDGSAGGVTFTIPKQQRAIADVTPDGLITALSPGKFTLNAQTYNGIKAKAVTLKVKPAPTSITLEQAEISMGVGDSWTLGYTLSEGSAGKVSFESDDTEVATVDEASGLITATGIGTANVKASVYGDVEATLRVNVVEAPDTVTLSASRDAIGVGEKLALDTELYLRGVPLEAEICTLKYESGNASIATVDDKGIVKGKQAGKATITVTAYNSTRNAPITASFIIKVRKAPGAVAIEADRTVLGVGEQLQLGLALPSGCAGGVTFTVPDGQDVGTVTPDGLFTAHGIGKVNVKATTYNDKSTTLGIEVRKAPTGVDIVSYPAQLGIGASGQLTAQLTDAESAGKLCYRITNGEECATIDENGKITAIAVGRVTLEVYTYVSGAVKFAFMDVVPAPTTLSLPANSINLGVGDKYIIEPIIEADSAASFSYTASKRDMAYASVNARGVVRGLKVGKSTIIVTTHNGLSARLIVNVKPQPSAMKANPAKLVLGIGESARLGATLSKNSATTLYFESEDEQIVTVEPDGTVTGLAVGDVNVKITTHNGLSAVCAISVVAAPDAISIDVPDVLGVGQKAPLNYILSPEGAHTTPVWEIVSGDQENVAIIKNGKLHALGEGTVTLRCSSHAEGISDELELTVLPAPTAISFAQDKYTVDIDKTLQLEPELEPVGCGSDLSYIIETEGFFEIDENGLVTPLKRGSSRVKATTYNGKSAITTVKVIDPYLPTAISLVEYPPESMDPGESFIPEVKVVPETADAELIWKTSSDIIMDLDPETGEMKALSPGRVTIKCVSQRNPKLKLGYNITVTSDERCLIMPNQQLVTDPAKINSVFAQIDDVHQSALDELQELLNSNFITQKEFNARKGFITRAFEMYRFAWSPNNKMLYWNGNNSEGGKKDFKTKFIYFGIPYTQSNRQSYPQWAISKGYYKQNNNGYYTMQTKKFSSRMYPGSDCSSFASMAVWGYNGSHRADNTTVIARASYYKTLGKNYWQDLRPGDLICYGGHHVVMFLYYVNRAKTQFVVIEQGGGSGPYYQYCNTISTSVRDQSYYSKYSIRRVSTLDMTFRDRV